jgi:hypothetical protein
VVRVGRPTVFCWASWTRLLEGQLELVANKWARPSVCKAIQAIEFLENVTKIV